jgi:hypothetical protein
MTWAEVRGRIREYAAYKDGWDSYMARGPRPEQTKRALQYALSMEKVGFPPPSQVVLEGDGDVDFEWEMGGHEVAISSGGECGAHFYERVRLDAEQSRKFREMLK